ncbi:type II toxin-antitoxin system RelE/ParE family toxin [Candidatus Daviesbacteria bacterium]|nr:type II toxin-antitoxin system RelE/ParE family toxin [Candidatus Daviesbacteria bacterium]
MIEDWQIDYYISPSGDSPVKNFLDKRPTAKAKAFRIFQYIKEYGLTAAIPHIKKLTGTQLWEIRILGEDNVRILYVTMQGGRILLLHAFAKKTNKTPPKEIDTALSRIPPIDK